MTSVNHVDIGTDIKTITGWLKTTGTCDKCVDRLLGKEYKIQMSVRPVDLPATDNSGVYNVCLGLLQWHCSGRNELDAITNNVQSSGFEYTQFSFALTVPLSLTVRDYAMWLTLNSKFPDYFKANPLEFEEIYTAKDVWKYYATPYFEQSLNCVSDTKSGFQVNIAYAHDDTDEYCGFLMPNVGSYQPKSYRSRYTRKRRHVDAVLSKQTVSSSLERMNYKMLSNLTPCPPQTAARPLVRERMSYVQASVYIAGRYNKYSRCLSQTPWLIDGERRLESSVQELICAHIEPVVEAQELRFSASGREDIDVRALGNGRPFIVECVNPKRALLTRADMATLMSTINSRTQDISVSHLQVVDKADTAILKQGEEEKVKTYRARCYSRNVLSQDVIAVLNTVKHLTIKQRTPVRVLHRRTSATRERVIHSMSVQLLDDHHFTLILSTQAGTYIKEFVHGDFGRTTPSVGTLLGVHADILELDVTEIHLDWPPPLTDQ